jgi:hypothetical protein
LQTQTPKAFRLEAVGFGSNQPTLGSAAPKVGAAGLKKLALQAAESLDDMTGVAALKGGAGQLQQEFLKSLVRVRRRPLLESRISKVTRQSTPSAS